MIGVVLAEPTSARYWDVPPEPAAGHPADIAPFGRVRAWTGAAPLPWAREHTLPGGETPTLWREHDPTAIRTADGAAAWSPLAGFGNAPSNLGLEWDEPRDVAAVLIRYRPEVVPAPEDVDLQYWWWSWPAPASAPGRLGWTHIDDRWFGYWKSADDHVATRAEAQLHTFAPLSTTEIAHAEGVAATHRRTRKIRLVFRAGVEAAVAEIRVFSGARWEKVEIDCVFDRGDASARRLVVANGYVLATAPDGAADTGGALPACRRDAPISGSDRWRVGLLATDRTPPSGDETIVTVDAGDRSFSFLTADLARGEIHVPARGARIVPLAGTAVADAPTIREQRIVGRVLGEPEQSLERAVEEIPILRKEGHRTSGGRYVPLGTDSNRQEFALQHNGNVFCDRAELMKPKPGDTDRLLWPGDRVAYRFGTGEVPDFREREDAATQSIVDGCLPLVRTSWRTDGIAYEQEAFATLLGDHLAPEATKRGDEPAVLLVKLSALNESSDHATAYVWMSVQPGEDLAVVGRDVVALAALTTDAPPYEAPRRRIRVLRAGGTLEPARVPGATEGAIRYTHALAPGEADDVILAIPFNTLTDAAELEQLGRLDYDAGRTEAIAYWRERVDAGARIEVPDAPINAFYRAVIPHVLISTDKDVPTGLYMNPAGTFRYDVFANETCIQVRMLDMRGYHDLARRYLEPFLHYQGLGVLPGMFASQRGVLHSAGAYTHVGYNLNHGWILWTLAEHYRFTRDAGWLRQVAAHLLEGCDWIAQERRGPNQRATAGERTRGLLPPGHLEDPLEWHHWYAVNAYAYRGLRATAEVLGEIGHVAAPSLAEEAASYVHDIRSSLSESIVLSPVVRLRDGTYVPHVPTRADIRGRDLGWIRDVLYGPTHLVECGILAPDGPEADWLLDDLEDNLFLSETHGLSPPADRWFSQGGITHQPNLVNTPLIYLLRDQVPLALRALYNTFAASLYRDVNAFVEWLPAFGIGGGPLYKAPDEAAWVIWLRNLLVLEDDDRLWLAKGTPRRWLEHGREIRVADAPTHFGPVGFHIRSAVGDGRVVADVEPPRRQPPGSLLLRLRHPDARPIRSVACQGARCAVAEPAEGTLELTDLQGPIRLVVTY